MWRGEAYADPLRRQTEGEYFHGHVGQHVFIESRNITSQTMDSNLQQLNVNGVSSFPNAMPPVQGPNNALFASQMEQQPQPSNFGLQMCENNYRLASHELGDAVFLRSMEMLNDHATNGLFTPGQRDIYCNEGERGMKRKGEEDYNPYLPVSKQHITDERMAAGMNNLYITTDDHNYCNTSMFNPDNALHTEFNSTVREPDNEMLSTEESFEDSCAAEQADGKMRRDYPVFQFSAPLEQFLKRKNDILPSTIINEICKPCLAVIPWAPPLHSEEELSKDNDNKNKVIKENTDILTQEIEIVEEDVM